MIYLTAAADLDDAYWYWEAVGLMLAIDRNATEQFCNDRSPFFSAKMDGENFLAGVGVFIYVDRL